MTDVQKALFGMKDDGYKKFHTKLIPAINPNLIIGVRTPDLRKFAKEFYRSEESTNFIKELPHEYYEENNLHAFLLEQIKNYDTALAETERFLPYIDNWATCDAFVPKVFKKNTDKLIFNICEWLKSDKLYTVRYAVGLLMKLYLGENFKPEYAELVSKIKSDEYYINMMLAWYFATALAKQYDAVIPYITQRRLDKWVHNKTIQKAVESYRIPPETKAYLKTFKISLQS